MNLAIGTLFAAGVLTFASPCVLPLIPVYLAVLVGGSTGEAPTGWARARLLLNAAAFILGFTLVFVMLGLAATALGQFLVRHRLVFQQLGGLLVFAFGLKFLGWLQIGALDQDRRFHLGRTSGMSPGVALLMGAAFAFGWTPCIGPVLGAVLTFTAVSTDSMAEGALNLGVYALGIGAPLFVVAVAADAGQRLVKGLKRFIPALEKTAGGMLVAMSVLMVTDNTTWLTFGLGAEGSAELSAPLLAGSAERTPSRTIVRAPKAMAAAEAACTDNASACGLGEAQGARGEADAIPPGPVVVDFYRPNCPACLKMVPVIDAMEQTCTAKGLSIARIDVSRSENRALAAEMGVVGTPTLIFIEPGGAEVARLVGTTDLTTVERAVSVLMGEACTDFGRL